MSDEIEWVEQLMELAQRCALNPWDGANLEYMLRELATPERICWLCQTALQAKRPPEGL